MKILQLTTHLDYGGIPTYVVSLSKALADMGHEPLVVSGGGALAKELDECGIPHVILNLRTKSELSAKVPVALFRLLHLIKAFKPDVIHAHTRVTQVIAHFAFKRSGVPYISTCHGFFRPHGARARFGCWGQRTIAISEKVKDHLILDFKVQPSRIKVIYNGIDLSRFERRPAPKEAYEFKNELGLGGCEVVGIIARLSSVKGHGYLLEAIAELARKRKTIRLLIVGDGPQEKVLKRHSEKLGIEDKVVFMGSTNCVQRPLSIMDVFALPSLKEGLGLSLLEAMAAGVPAVASSVGGIVEVIEDGESGVLVKPKDPGALADAINFLLENRKRADAMAKAARARIFERFGLQEMARKVAGVYEEAKSEKLKAKS